ncbi:hypothetical protein [Mucilaginibacter sp.]|uniref:hypothetical protein n=1 Tax=Mucilaginibacter sp. TaxID=1882438 RepID=UPI003B00FFD2
MSTKTFNDNNKRIINNIEESLQTIIQQKDIIVKLNRYEDAAKLRDIEKSLIEIQEKLKEFRLPAYLDVYNI